MVYSDYISIQILSEMKFIHINGAISIFGATAHFRDGKSQQQQQQQKKKKEKKKKKRSIIIL